MSIDEAMPESALQQVEDTGQDTSPEGLPPDVMEITSIEGLAKQLAETSLKAQDNWDKWVRSQAEFENFKRRTEKDLQNAHKYALEKFARELLMVMDSLELGIKASTPGLSEVEKLREGMELTLKQLEAVFEKFGILAIDPLGEKFNPDQHQAMAAQPVENAEPNTVVKVFQKGYSLNDRLLRPAMVVIAQQVGESTYIDQKA